MEKDFYDIQLTFVVPLSNAQRAEVQAALNQLAAKIQCGTIVLCATDQVVQAVITPSNTPPQIV
jgi:hypothetical protein